MKRLSSALILATVFACASPPVQNEPAPGGAGAQTELLVLSTTDVHGRIRAWDYYADSVESVRGLTRAATIVDSIRAANPGRVLLVDAGDLLQGNPFAYVAMKQFGDSANPIIAAMNAMRYDAAAIGNHEYNYGVPYLERAVLQAKFPMLSANTWKTDGTLKFKAWTIVQREGIRIGIVGATTPGVMVWDAENVRGRVKLTDIVPAVRTAVGEVRKAGANVVIVSLHSGLNEPSSYDTVSTGVPSENVAERVAKEIPDIDLVIYGHSHKEQKDLHIGSTLLVQPRNWATSVGVAHLTVTREGGSYRVSSSRGETIQSKGHAEQTTVFAGSARTHTATLAYVNEVVGNTSVAWRGDSARLKDTPLIDLIAEVERKAAHADLASTAAFTLDANLPAGPITVARIAQLYPYDNTLRAVRITGRQLRDYLEYSSRYYKSVASGKPEIDPEIPGYNFDIVSGADYTMDLTKPIGSRITSLTYKGKPVQPMDTFTLALNNYRQTGGGGYAMLKDAPVVFDQQQEIRQLLIDEVRSRGTLKPEDYFTRNWSLLYGVGSTTIPVPSGPRLRIIGTNDLHGQLEPLQDASGLWRGGVAHTATVIHKAQSECAADCHYVLLDAGDLFQGTPISNLSYGRPVMEYYNRMGYTAVAVGNHEFDWGQDTLKARMRQAKFPFLSANIRFKDGRDVPWIANDTIVVKGKTKVGIIGIITPSTATSTLPANVSNLSFADPATVIDAEAKSLRTRGADVIVVVAHDGGFCNKDTSGSESCTGEIFQIAPKITEKIDVILAGHSHSLLNTRVNNIPIVEAFRWGQTIEVVDIPLDVNGKVAGPAVTELRPVLTDSAEAYAPVDSMVRKAAARVAPIVNRKIGAIATSLERDKGNQYPLGNLLADSYRWAGKGDIAFMNTDGIRQRLPAGEITYGRLFLISPFANTLYRVRMTGSQLRGYLEKLVSRSSPGVHVSGISIGYDPDKPAGSRIATLSLPDGKTLSDNAVYTIIMNSFMAGGGSNLGPPEGAESTPLNIVDLDATVDYIKSRPQPLAIPSETRIFIAKQ
jgi:2',3'-cyclic-nucleotide 2'-phosphodiesterase (5'-nucleotidase family)